MKELSLEESQRAGLSILKKIDSICETENIKYWVIYGTLIGAIRHKGFIPWDDDIDIAMYRDEYDKLAEYFGSHDTGLELHNKNTKKDCFYNITRICDKEHLCVFDGKKYRSGLFVDVYIMDGLGGDEDKAYWDQRFSEYNRLRKMVFLSCNTSIIYGASILTKIGNIPLCILAKIKGKRHYLDSLSSFKHFDISESKYVGMPDWESSRYERKDFDETLRVPFEDIEVNIPAGYDNILKCEYGDYMELPPEDKRKPQHGFRAFTI